PHLISSLFFSTSPAPPHTYPLSLHDALPISCPRADGCGRELPPGARAHQALRLLPLPARRDGNPGLGPLHSGLEEGVAVGLGARSEEHTSELQSRSDLVCRLLLEKKKTNKI